MPKSRDTVVLTLERIGIAKGFHVGIDFTRNIPIGKGLSSSTADMLAAIRAIQEVFGFLLTETFVSSLMAMIEPHDALHYNSSVVYNHRQGRLLRDFGHIPQWWLVIVDSGGQVNTVVYNDEVAFTSAQMRKYDALFQRLCSAFRARHDGEIASCASESARLHADLTANDFIRAALSVESEIGAVGTVATHSGTCAGFLFPAETPRAALDRIAAEVGARLAKDVFLTRSLRLLT
jgi:uncharacterized protein involved in propanediol utilization